MEKNRISATALSIFLLIVFYNVGRKLTESNGKKEDDYHYVVEFPRMMGYVGLMGIIVGGIVVVFFSVNLLIKTKGATIGHVVLGVVVATVALIMLIASKYFSITINENQMQIRKGFLKSTVYNIRELQVIETTMGNLRLYSNGKKLITVHYECENIDRLLKTLQENNLLPKEEDDEL